MLFPALQFGTRKIFSHLQGDKGGFPGVSWQFSGFSTLFFIRLKSCEIGRYNGEGIGVRK
jgi:hypothetical protein